MSFMGKGERARFMIMNGYRIFMGALHK